MAGITTSAEGTADRESHPALPLSPPVRESESDTPATAAPLAAASTTPAPGSLRELMTVAVPLILSSGSVTLMITIDRLFLTWYSEEALAASLPAAAMHWTVMAAFIGMINYGNAFVAQYEGAGRKDRVAASVWQGIFLAIGAGLVFLLVIPLAPFLFAQAGHDPVVQKYETQFLQTLSFGAVPMLLTMAFGCFYSGRGKTRVVMYVDFLLAATNIALDPCLIFGLGPFPRLGIVGAGLATVTAYTVAVIAYVVLSFRHRDSIEYEFWKHVGLDRELLGRLLRYGIPTGLQMAAELSAFTVFLVLIGRLGEGSLAATNLAFNVNMMSFVPMIGLATAVMTLVGKRVGEGRPKLAERHGVAGRRRFGSIHALLRGPVCALPQDHSAALHGRERVGRAGRHRAHGHRSCCGSSRSTPSSTACSWSSRLPFAARATPGFRSITRWCRHGRYWCCRPG